MNDDDDDDDDDDDNDDKSRRGRLPRTIIIKSFDKIKNGKIFTQLLFHSRLFVNLFLSSWN